MQSLKGLVWASLLVCACSSSTAEPESPLGPEGVTKVVAEVQGITCPTCAAVAEVALRQRLAEVGTIAISQSQQTIAVVFSSGRGVFSPGVFRDAVASTGIEVMAFHVDACGIIEEKESQNWFVAGENQFALVDSKDVPRGKLLCVSGQLDDRAEPYRFTLTAIHAALY